jgi:Rieske Fe-S protein
MGARPDWGWDVEQVTRRDALRLTAGVVAAMGSVSCSARSEPDDQSGTSETPRSSTTTSSRRVLAAVTTVPDDGVLDVTATAGEPAYLIRSNDAIRAVSATCTHANCRVSWQPSGRHFRCPCHGGTYDPQGLVLGGPPPRALEELPVVIDDGNVYLDR